MKIEAALFERQLKTPFSYGKLELHSRSGIYLKATSEEGVFYSEAAPLPGHSQENIEDCKIFLTNVANRKIMPAAIRFAITGLSAQRVCLAKSTKSSVISNAMIPWGEETPRLIESALSRGYSTLKLKVSPRNVTEISTLVRSVLQKHPTTRFRLDANRSLTLEQLGILNDSFIEERAAIEYIEEPTAGDWSENSKSAIPLAADESANSLKSIVTLQKAKHKPDFFIIKPTVLGGIFPLENSVVTSALESEAGRRSIIACLLQVEHKKCAGISTGFLFKDNHFPDEPVYGDLSMPNEQELKYYDSLSWSVVEL